MKTSFRFLLPLALLALLSACGGSKPAVRISPAPVVAHTDTTTIPKVPRHEKFGFLRPSAAEDRWVDSLYNGMDFFEKAGQLFMVAAYSNREQDTAYINGLERMIRQQHVGGLIFFQGGPYRQARLTNRFQTAAKVPLFIGIDAEWGVSMRLDSTYRFPWNMTLGAIRDKGLLESVGHQMGKESRRLGVHFTFGPVLDINTNPKNPIISFRSFGEDKQNVTNSALAVMRGLQREGVLATGKHFPGHGDTEADSHYALPVVNFSRERMTDTELYPYRVLFEEGLASVMVAHLNVPAYEVRPDFPSSVSKPIVTGLLQEEMGFDGLIFTDALNMKAAANFRAPGEIDLDAFLAGNDVLLFPENVPTAIEKLCVAYQDSILTEERLARSVKKILHYKYKVGLHKRTPIELAGLADDMNPAENIALQYKLFENALTVLRNQQEVLPIADLTQERIAYVKLGDDDNTAFLSTLRKYADVTEVSHADNDTLSLLLQPYSKVIVGFHKSDKAWKKHDFTSAELEKLRVLAHNHKVILDVFARPYALIPVDFPQEIEGLVLSHQNAEIAQEVSASLIFGAIGASGVLPVSVGTAFKPGDGLTTHAIGRLGFTAPENVGMSTASLSRIDQEARKAIATQAVPGMQILVARKGKVVYHKAFGYHTYEPECRVQLSDLYDIASMTKVLATLPLVMQQYDKGHLTATTQLGQMVREMKGTNKESIEFSRLLSHYAGLQAWEPFYKSTLDDSGMPDKAFYRRQSESGFSTPVADSLFIRDDYRQTMLAQIGKSPLTSNISYKYSDFTFLLLQAYLEEHGKRPLNEQIQSAFFTPLGASSTLFRPLERFDRVRIVPSERDGYFRHQLLQGHVHDMAAGMLGGVAGHAGLFSNAIDVAKIMQMYLWKGQYAGQQYFSPATFAAFNTCHFCGEGNRRGWGFDKPQLPGTVGPTCNCVSPESFGHTGFTGTMCWADPATETIFVFLSNRTFPDSNAPNKLSKDNVRENIQKIIQESITTP